MVDIITITLIECPRCGQKRCFYQNSETTNEESTFCKDCGYNKSRNCRRDDEGNYLLADESKGNQINNFIIEEELIDNPYGAFEINCFSGRGLWGTITNEGEYEQFEKSIPDMIKNDPTINEVIFSRLIDGVIKKELLYEQAPDPEKNKEEDSYDFDDSSICNDPF